MRMEFHEDCADGERGTVLDVGVRDVYEASDARLGNTVAKNQLLSAITLAGFPE